MYADAGPFVFALAGDPRLPYVSESVRMIRAAARGERLLSTAVLTWDEVAYAVRRLAGPQLSVQKGQELLALPGISWLAVDPKVLRRASGLYGAVPMRPRDAIHAACALEYGETEIVSDDAVFDHVLGLRRVWPP